MTFSVLSPRTSFINLVKGSNSALHSSSFFLVVIIDVKTLLGARLQFVAIELLELLDGILIDRIAHVKHLKTLLPVGLQERRGGHSRNALACDEIDVVLSLLHAVDVFLEGDALITSLAYLVAQELSNLDTVGGVLADADGDASARRTCCNRPSSQQSWQASRGTS